MNVRILGPLEVRDRGGLVDIRGRKPRALLAALSLQPGQAVTTDALIDALWGEAPPRTARAALQNYVAQLRRALGPGVLESRGGGYALELRPEDVDLGLFERLTAEARRLSGDGRIRKLREALALWRGPALADVVFEPFAAPEAARLDELRTAALEDLVDARLALGAGPDLVSELEGLISEHPFRERLRGQLMVALYRSGRQADALEAYQDTRRLLVEELGIEPGAPLRELEAAILRQEAALDAPEMTEPASPAEERRKTVTVLLADVASPGTRDPELLHDSSVRALATIRAVLEEHGATVEQRAGDEVLAVFGIPQVHEDDATRAVRAALDLDRELGALSGVLEEEGRGRLELRVAIESGEALVGVDETGHGFATGAAVGAAKRLLGHAAPGEVVAGLAAVRLLGDTAVLEPPRDGAARVAELRENVPPLSRRLERPLVDRRDELAALRAAFAEAAASRRCRIVLVLGEAGIGKTRLARELRRELEAAATVLVGRCAAYGRGVTLLPLAEIIRGVRERRPLAELLAGDAHADLVAARLAGLTGEDDAPASGGETFWAVRRLFEACAADRPLVLVLEDLHWAEPTLLDLVDYLGDRATGPMLFLGLARQELLEDRPAWSERDATLLAPLLDDDSEALIESVGSAPDSLRAHIVRTAGGNPLFIEQLLAHADESDEHESLPPSLDALLASRLDRLEPAELAVLQRGAVAGAEFSRDAVLHLLDEEPAALDRHLVAGVGKGLLRVEDEPDGRFRFHHVLIRDAAYATLPKAQRAALHERVARWLESQPERTDELVGFHLEQAHDYVVELGLANGRAAVLASEAGARLGEAGLRAWRRADVAAAADLLSRAARLLPQGDPGRLELLCELGLALRTTGEIARAEQVLREAAETATADGDLRLELRARLELANVTLSSRPEGGADRLLQLAEDAIPRFAELGDDRSLGRAWLLSGYVHGGQHCQNARWTEAAERALAHYRRAGWPTAACVGELATSLYYGPVPVPEAVERCRLLLAEVSDRGGEARVLAWLGGLEAFAGRFDAARSLVERASELYDDLGYRIELASARGAVLGEIELLAGRPELAEEVLRTCCDVLAEMHMGVLLASRASELAEVLYRQGRYDDAAGWLELAGEHAAADDIGAQFLRRTVEAKLLARRGLDGEAEAVAHEAVALAEPTDAVNNRAKVALDLAEVLKLAGKGPESDEAARRALEGFERKGNLVGAERARRFLG